MGLTLGYECSPKCVDRILEYIRLFFIKGPNWLFRSKNCNSIPYMNTTSLFLATILMILGIGLRWMPSSLVHMWLHSTYWTYFSWSSWLSLLVPLLGWSIQYQDDLWCFVQWLAEPFYYSFVDESLELERPH